MSEKPENVPIAEIEHGPSAFEQFLDNNQKKLIIIGILVILGLAAYLIVSEMRESHRAKAGAAFAAARDIPSLREVAETYPDTPAAGSALIRLSQLQWDDGRQKESLATLESFLAKFPDHPAAPAAEASLGSRNLEIGNTDEAKAHFNKVLSFTENKSLAPIALLSLGDIARREGRIEEAREFYQRVSNPEYAGIVESNLSIANERLQILEVNAPEMTEPVPAAPGSDPVPDSTSPQESGLGALPNPQSTNPHQSGLGLPPTNSAPGPNLPAADPAPPENLPE